jgi:transposase
MWLPSKAVKVYLVLGHTDMRKSVNGLAIMISGQMGLDPLSGHLFVFCNRRKNILKILYWDRNGFCLWYKRLEKDLFRWPKESEEILEMGHQELGWLLSGLEVNQALGHSTIEYQSVF